MFRNVLANFLAIFNSYKWNLSVDWCMLEN